MALREKKNRTNETNEKSSVIIDDPRMEYMHCLFVQLIFIESIKGMDVKTIFANNLFSSQHKRRNGPILCANNDRLAKDQSILPLFHFLIHSHICIHTHTRPKRKHRPIKGSSRKGEKELVKPLDN